MTSQPDDGQTFEQSASQRPVASTSDADHAVTSSPPLDIPFHMNSIWPLLKSCANALVRVAICSFQPASQPGPGDLECFDMTAPAGSFPVDVRMRDRQVAMRFTASGEPMMVHFTVVKSPIRREQGKGDFPCFISTAPKRGELVCVDTVECSRSTFTKVTKPSNSIHPETPDTSQCRRWSRSPITTRFSGSSKLTGGGGGFTVPTSSHRLPWKARSDSHPSETKE